MPACADGLRPEPIRFGATTAEVEAALEGRCASGFETRPIEPPFLPRVEDRQVQVDCDGLDFLGEPRWVEFVVGDDRLQMVWLMVDEDDEGRVIAALREAHGEPSHRSEDYVAFHQARVAWRFEPPEVLYYAPELDDWILGSFE
jgi:hypothetical protein